MRKIIFVAMLLLAFSLAGCGGSPTEPADEADVAEEAEPAETPTEPEAPVEEDSWAGKLKEIVGMGTKYTATYTMDSMGQEMTMTYYVASTTKMRIDTMSQGTESSIYILGSESYMCSKQEAEWSCFGGDQSEQMADSYDNAKRYSKLVETDINYVGTETIAGEVGQCYDVKVDIPNMGKSESTICYTTDGIMLKTEATGSTMVATSISRSVDSGAFDLPATPMSAEEMMAQYM